MAIRIPILLKSILCGTFLGLVGAVLYFLVVLATGGIPEKRVFDELGDMCLVFGIASFICAAIGGWAAHTTVYTSKAPYWRIAVVVVLVWSLLLFVTRSELDSSPAALVISFLAANSFLSGWYAIRVVRKAVPIPTNISPDVEQMARSRFEPRKHITDTDAIREQSQELKKQ